MDDARRDQSRRGPTQLNPTKLLKAIAFAANKHRDQRRKDAEASPYINHPIAVATVLAAEGDVSDEGTLIAAALHDTVEDTETTFEELEKNFGPEVAGLVRVVTDDKSFGENGAEATSDRTCSKLIESREVDKNRRQNL